MAKPNDKLINAAKRIIKYLVKTKELGITWKITAEDRKTGFGDVIFGVVDASFGEIKYLRELARGLGFGQTEPTLIYEDNRVVILTAEAECSAGGRFKHVDVKYRFVTEAVRNREVRVSYIPTNLNFADIMTKALVSKKHKEGVDLIIKDKDTYRIVTSRREMTDEKYKTSYFIIQQDGDSDGLY